VVVEVVVRLQQYQDMAIVAGGGKMAPEVLLEEQEERWQTSPFSPSLHRHLEEGVDGR